MKKALSVFLMIAVAFGAFAAEPAADVKVAEFAGNASVTWGVDLDSGTTGFKNDYEVNLKLNLLNNGTKSTTGDGVWGELVLKTDGDSFLQWQNKDQGTTAFASNKGMTSALNYKVYVDTAKIHIGPAYVGLKAGDTQTGELKMDAAIRSSDNDAAKWLTDVGPKDYSQGIVLGYDSDMFKVDLDVRSKPHVPQKDTSFTKLVITVKNSDGKDKDTGAYAEGDVITFADGTTYTVSAADVNTDPSKGPNGQFSAKPVELSKPITVKTGTENDNANKYYYTDNYAVALEGEFKGIENLSVKAGVSYSISENYKENREGKNKTAEQFNHVLGYSASAGYKFNLNDTFFIRPQVGFTGSTGFAKVGDVSGSTTTTEMALGLLFGWGDIGQDKNAGVYYLDGDAAKKVTPGIGVVAHIPFASVMTSDNAGNKMTQTNYGEVAARIMPSFYSGEIIPGLTAAAYADIVVQQMGEDKVDGTNVVDYKNPKDTRETPMAFAVGAKYALPIDAVTITPQVGLRFANAAYVDYGTTEKTDNKVFSKMGDQKKKAADEKGITSDGNYMNLKLGVDVTGLISNTTLSVVWETANILNAKSNDTENINKLGTLGFTAKISL